ncbi:MAG: hypothetical protein LBF22_06015, partial [Deltaproteobacteria bacterium]|nr:hypothetical protein [Deltaproteobacteria bacterium]
MKKVNSPSSNKTEEIMVLNLSPAFSVNPMLWRSLCNKIERLLTSHVLEQRVGLFDEFAEQEAYLNNIATLIVEEIKKKEASAPMKPLKPADELVKVKDIVSVSATTFGGEIIALKAVKDLNIPSILRELHFDRRQCSLAIAQIIARMLHPASEDETSRWLQTHTSLPKLLNLDPIQCYPMALHRIGDKLGANKNAIEDQMFNLPSLFTPRKFILFLDLTNTFFEGTAETISLAKRGFSKEKRIDCPLISLALCINQEGFVVKTLFLPGNVSEPTALEKILDSTNVSDGNFMIMDKGVATKDNLEML